MAGIRVFVCVIMAGPRGQKEIGRVQTPRYASAFITSILLEARRRVSEGDTKIDGKKKQIISEQNRQWKGQQSNVFLVSAR